MNTIISKHQSHVAYKILSCFIAFSFLLSVVTPAVGYAQAQSNTVLNLPAPGQMVNLSHEFRPAIIKGMTFHPDNPLEFDFIVDTGEMRLSQEQLKEESNKLVKYFLASLTVPEEEMWVNLSPYENDRIIPEAFGYTEMGRDLLAQDYLLKQITASLIYPEEEIGEEFWDTVYERAYHEYGSVNIPVNTFNKIWIVPKDAVVAEKGNEVFVLNKKLKVMLEEDYVALQHSMGIEKFGLESIKKEDIEELSGVSADVVREILIPAIEKEVNTGKNFAQLRQIYNSMILATWFKQNLKESLLGKVYVDQNKVKGVDVEDKEIKQKIYNQYVEAFKKGVYNYVKEDYDPTSQQIIPRKYFSGGMVSLNPRTDYTELDFDDNALTVTPVQRSMADRVNRELIVAEQNSALQKVHIGLLENTANDDFAIAVSSAEQTQSAQEALDQIQALQKELTEYRSVATIDHLTQLPNRRAYYSDAIKRIQQIQDGSLGRRRSDNLLAVYTADINEFKFFNEMFGHDVGDEVLKGLGTLINAKVEGAHQFARIGGEEFYGAMPQVELDEVNQFLDGLSSDLVEESPLVFPSLNNPIIVKRAIDEKVEAISQDIVQAIDTAIERNELPANYDKTRAIEAAKQTGIFDESYQRYMVQDLSKIKNGMIHQFVFQGITDNEGNTLSEQQWNQKGLFSLLNIASEKMERAAVTISSGATLLEPNEIGDASPQETIVRLMNEADIAMYRSKENKNVQIETVAFNESDSDMSSKLQQVDFQSALAQVSDAMSGTSNVEIRTDLFNLRPEQIEEHKAEILGYRDQLQNDIHKLRAVSESDVVAGPGIYNTRGLEHQMNVMVGQMRQVHSGRATTAGEDRRTPGLERRQRLQYVSIDLGDLKIFNDIFGHATGDKLINVFAQTAKNEVGEFGSVARYGGDEFAIVLQGTRKNADTTLQNLNNDLLQLQEFQLPEGALRQELQGLKGDARDKFLRAVRRQIVMQREDLRAQGKDVPIETLMEDSQLENIPMDVLTTWKPVFSAGIASYDPNIMGNWSVDEVQKTLSIASDRAQERAKTEMRASGTFVTYGARDVGVNLATVRQQEDYAITTAFNNELIGEFTRIYPQINARTDQQLNMFPPTVHHRSSLDNIIAGLKQKDVLADGLDTYANVWTDIHDTGYRGAEIDFDDPEFEERLKDTWNTIGEAVGLDTTTTNFKKTVNETYELLRNNSDPNRDFVGNLFMVKILGHGSVGMAINTQELMNEGISENEAKAIAMLAAAHHPGFPINFVQDTVLPGMGRELPSVNKTAELPILLIDMEPEFRTLVMADYVNSKLNNTQVTNIIDLRQQYESGEGQEVIDQVTRTLRLSPEDLANVFTIKGNRDTITKIAGRTGIPQRQVATELKARRQASANYLRMKIADYVADNLGVMDRANARMHALLGYGLDRITPANPGGFSRDPQTRRIQSVGGEIIDKKYGLVASSNITAYDYMTLFYVYERAITNVEEERDAFVNAVEDMKIGLDAQGVALLDELKEGLVSESNNLIEQTKTDQKDAMNFVNTHLRNADTITFSGHIRDIDTDIAIVKSVVDAPDFTQKYSVKEQQAAAYLLRSLNALNTDSVKKHLASLRSDVSDYVLSEQLPAQTSLVPEEVFSNWVLIGGQETEIQVVLDVLESEEDIDAALTQLRQKAKEGQQSLDVNRADHLLRVAHFSMEQAQRDGANRRALLANAEDYALATTQKKNRNVGGINLNANLLDLQIKRDQAGVPLPAFEQPINDMKIDGFLPVIIDIAPIQNVPLFLSFKDQGTNTGV